MRRPVIARSYIDPNFHPYEALSHSQPPAQHKWTVFPKEIVSEASWYLDSHSVKLTSYAYVLLMTKYLHTEDFKSWKIE